MGSVPPPFASAVDGSVCRQGGHFFHSILRQCFHPLAKIGRIKMKSDLRKNPHRSMGRYWLTMSDASAFTLVRSSIAIADELRVTLSDKEKLLITQSSAELAVLMLTAAEAGWGKGKMAHLVSQMVDVRKLDNHGKGRVYLLIRDAMTRLPTMLWPQEKMQMRRELLEELTRQINLYQDDASSVATRDEIRERQWRESVLAMRQQETRIRS
ncbi:hypothetical protein [Herbaspirillum huttiense]|uniref:hypothetical protein n=1 Tax=Herbaspirillum huttiense TaxID=863372 RepID=UPI002176DF7E|nr:hypothetical protein [Herbaspirillum huttiense]UWE18933.1 hypothetical protein NY669_12370 [Herbaspirillum huttiense]